MYFEVFVSLQTDEESEEDELGKGEQGVSISHLQGEESEEDELGNGEQGVSISHLQGESGYQGWWWFSCDTCVVLLFY
jgi:hypothetical protein